MEKSQSDGYKPTSFDDLDEAVEFIDDDYIKELTERQRSRETRDSGELQQDA